MSCKQSDHHCVDSGAGEDKMSQIKRSRRSVVGCNNEYSSRHLLPSSELLKTQRINVTFIFEGNAPLDLESMFVQIIRDPASPTVKGFFYESLQIAFSNSVLISKFHYECG